MNHRKQITEDIFHAAMELPPGGRREQYVQQVCADDEPLLRSLEELLDGAAIGEAMLEAGGPGEAYPWPQQAGPEPGDRIGRYKLLEKIGEGGCGIVYMAEQEEPVRRRVAVKIIKPGMDSREVIARFEAERQALAMMDHPNIARVFDGGVTGNREDLTGKREDSRGGSESCAVPAGSTDPAGQIINHKSEILNPPGRPYFVMELVRGVRITEYCQEHALSTRERLDLFMQVCSAVQHAHQKGIIHRDLKPSNILVTELDGRPVPKVIDFGIARATEQKLTDKTLFTQFAQFIGTPAYMSPEQAAMSGADIDTRSDIYSLGVLLYELLTGTTPFDAKELLHAGFDEMRRIIRETEPQKPSTRLTQSESRGQRTEGRGRRSEIGGQKSEVSDRKSALPSDLDWIVMRCLEKDRARRYETATGLAQDIQRHLSSEPVIARPASAAYRFRKMVRRNKVAFTAGGAVAAALVIGLGVSVWQFTEKSQALERAQAAEEAQRDESRKAETEAEKSRQVAQFLKDMLAGVGPSAALGDDTKMVRKILDKTVDRIGADLNNQPDVEAELRTVIGKVYDALGDYEKAAAMLTEALAITKRLRGEEHKEVVYLLNAQGQVLAQQGELAEAEAMLRQALAMDRKLAGPDGDVSTSLNNLGLILGNRGSFAEAETVHREALAMNRKFAGNEHEDVATSLSNLAVVLSQQGKLDEAETVLREALDIHRKVFGNEHPVVASTLNNLAGVTQQLNKLEESEKLFREVLPLQRKLLGNAHPNVAAALNGLALAILKQDRAAEAEPFLRQGLEIERKARKTAHPQTSTLIGNLGRVMEAQRKFDEAEALYREAMALLGQLPGPEHPAMTSWRNRLHNLLQSQGKPNDFDKADAAPNGQPKTESSRH